MTQKIFDKWFDLIKNKNITFIIYGFYKNKNEEICLSFYLELKTNSRENALVKFFSALNPEQIVVKIESCNRDSDALQEVIIELKSKRSEVSWIGIPRYEKKTVNSYNYAFIKNNDLIERARNSPGNFNLIPFLENKSTKDIYMTEIEDKTLLPGNILEKIEEIKIRLSSHNFFLQEKDYFKKIKDSQNSVDYLFKRSAFFRFLKEIQDLEIMNIFVFSENDKTRKYNWEVIRPLYFYFINGLDEKNKNLSELDLINEIFEGNNKNLKSLYNQFQTRIREAIR
jgi:hypothetical protein